MAKPTTKTFAQLIVEINTAAAGATPVWTAPCGFKSKGADMSGASSTTTLPDCDEPEAAAWEETGITALSGQITGSGAMAAENSPLWEGWFDSGASMQIRITTVGVGYRIGNGVLTALGATVALGTEANRIQRSITIKNDGPWPWTAGAPT